VFFLVKQDEALRFVQFQRISFEGTIFFRGNNIQKFNEGALNSTSAFGGRSTPIELTNVVYSFSN
jgi:hypothetical protein